MKEEGDIHPLTSDHFEAEESVCIVAILKDEQAFVEEWLAYHKLLGVTHFILFDNSDDCVLQHLLAPYEDFVYIVPWGDRVMPTIWANKQIDAYNYSLRYVTQKWLAFLDGDEFIVLNKHSTLGSFLAEQHEASSVFLRWHIFGHAGFFEDPPGLVTQHLIRRRQKPSESGKSITRRDAIITIESAHACKLRPGSKVISTKVSVGEGTTRYDLPVANINHYMCRSFETWMKRVDRGSAHLVDGRPISSENLWRVDDKRCLREFVEMTTDANELVDSKLRTYASAINRFVSERRLSSLPDEAGNGPLD